ncbi:MAG: PssE/Cps14G family polysaccharide biosynthesis glycosyltransferase [Chloroflexota bacterium]
MTSHSFFVTVGSTDFDLLVQSFDDLMPQLIDNQDMEIEAIAQIGHGKYEPTHIPFFRFANPLDPYYHKSSIVIAHGGLATTMEVLKLGIPLISVSNLDRYDNHQDDLLSTMADLGYLVWCRKLDDLGQAIDQAMTTPLKTYETPECNIHTVIHDFLSVDA